MGGNFGRALETAIPQALSNITSMQNLAISQKQEQRAIETHQIEMVEKQREIEKVAKEEKRLNSIMDITVHPAYTGLPQDQRPKILDFFHKNKFTDASGKGSIRDILTGVKMLESSKSLFTEFMSPVIEGKKQTYLQKNAELQELISKGDTKKVQELTPIVNQLRTGYLSSLNNFGEHVAKLEEIEASKKTEKEVLPYKIGERHKFIGKDGKEYEGTFTGLDINKEPVWGNIAKIFVKPAERESVGEVEAKTIARKKAQVKAAEDILGRKLTEDEKKKIVLGGGLESILEQLLSGTGSQGGGMVYDSKSRQMVPGK